MEKLHSIEPVLRTVNNRAQLAAEFCGLGESIPGTHNMMAKLIAERVAE